ncbi:zf-TFIIB domain-containing protein [Cystobacter fuscus]|uniref:TFIIB-type zinc ribbon-containing protein n=1 Tax=Cystobacter fuscus TaxID=43 RepID=UPI0037BEBC44
MKCPECKQPMLERAFEGRNGTRVTIDVCQECGGLWFDTHESLRLSPTGTLQLFRAVYGQRGSYHPRRSGTLSCPRGDEKLALVHDMAHGHRFQYSRCPQQHGHFITFFQFLREKGLARELTPKEQAELRKHVDTLLCSDCGEPVRLANMTACARCRAPLSLLDPDCVETTLREAQKPGDSRRDVAPEVAARLLMANQGATRFRPSSPPRPQATAPLVVVPAAEPSNKSETFDLIVSGGELLMDALELLDLIF